MAVISVPGPYSGQSYSVRISGDTPSVDEQYRIDAYVRDREKSFLQQYEQTMGTPLQTGESEGVLNYLGEIPKGVARGGVGLVESAALGVAGLLPESWETSAREGIRSLAYELKPQADLGLEDTVGGKFGEALGSTVPIYASAFIPAVGPYIAGGLALGSGAGQAMETARADGATEEERARAGLLGAGVGLTNLIPLAGPIGRALKTPGVWPVVARTLEQAGLEGTQEAVEGLLQNAIRQGYNPDALLTEGIAEQAGYGAGVGGVIQLLAEVLIPGRSRAGTPPPDTSAAPVTDTAATPAAPTAPTATTTPAVSTESTLSAEELASLDLELASATDTQRTLAVLDRLGVSPNAAMRKRVTTNNYAPDSAELVKELEQYKRTHLGNAKLQEISPDTPQLIDDYIAMLSAPKEVDSATTPTGAGASATGNLPSVADGSLDGNGADTGVTTTPDLRRLGDRGTRDGDAVGPTVTQPPAVETTPAGEQILMPGVEPLTPEQTAVAQKAAEEAAKKVAAEPMDEGLFATPAATADLVDMADSRKREYQERLQKYPLANAFGGVAPNSELASELAIAGITPKSHPGLFNANGIKVPDDRRAAPDALPSWAGTIQEDETGNAFDRTDFLNAIIDEANGSPRRVGKQAELEYNKTLRDEADRYNADPKTVAPVVAPAPVAAGQLIPPRDQDISTDGERYDDVRSAVDSYTRTTGATLSQSAYNEVVDILDREGGSVAEAVDARRPASVSPVQEDVPGFSSTLEDATPSMKAAEFEGWLESQVGDALNAAPTASPDGRSPANKRSGANVSARFKLKYDPTRPAHAEAVLDEARQVWSEVAKNWDTALTDAWEVKIGALSSSAQSIVRSFIANPGDIVDPSTAGDRKNVWELTHVKSLSPQVKAKPGMESAEYAKRYFDKFPTVAEALQLLARDLSSDTAETRLISNATKAQGDMLSDYSEASAFMDNLVGPAIAPKAAEWVATNLSAEANAYLQAEANRMRGGIQAARRRVTKFLDLKPAEAKRAAGARAAVSEVEAKSRIYTEMQVAQAANNATAEAANVEARAEAWAVDAVSAEVTLPNLPESVTASTVELAKAKKPSVPRKKGETGIDYAIRVHRPELTDAQRKALTPEERAEILAEAKAAWDFLGGALYRRIGAVKQAFQMHIPLDGVAVAALRNGQLESALRYLSMHVPDAQVADLLSVYADNISGTNVAIIDPAHPDLRVSEAEKLRNSHGLYYPKYDTIVLKEDSGLTLATLLHEVTHAVTLAELRKPGSALRADLQRVLDAVYDSIVPYMPGNIDVEEFVAEIKSNEALRSRLAQLNADGLPIPPQSYGKSVLEWIKNLMGRFIKRLARTPAKPSALDTADALIDMAVTPDRVSSGDYLYSKRFGAGVHAVMDQVRAVTNAKGDTPSKIASDTSKYMDLASRNAQETLLGVMTTLSVGDLAKEVGIKDPYAMMTTIQALEAKTAIATDQINMVRKRFKALPKQDRTLLDVLTFASSAEGVDLTDSPDTYTKWWLAYENLDADGNVIGRRRIKADSAAARDDLVAKLNTNPAKNRTVARAVHNPDPSQIRAYNDLKAEFNKLSPQGKQMYVDLRDTYKKHYDQLWDVLSGSIDGMTFNDPEFAGKLKQSAYLMLFGKGEINPYFPLVREGEFVLEFSMFNPVTQSTEPVVRHFESPLARDAFVAKLKDNPAAAKNADGSAQVLAYTQNDFAATGMANRSMFVADTVNLLTQYNAKHGGTDKAISEDTMQELAQMLIAVAPEGSMARQFHRRKNVAGYAESNDLALEKRGYNLASAPARYFYGRKIRDLQKTYKEQATKNPNQKQVAVLNELAKLGNTVLKPQNTPIERAARAANKVTYMYTLLGSVAGSLVNFSGMANVIYPQLGGTYGYRATAAAIQRASRTFLGSGFRRTGQISVGGTTETEALKSMPSLDNYYILDETGKYALNPEAAKTDKQRARAEFLMPVMQALGDRGMSHKSLFYDSAGLENAGRASSIVERAMAFFGAPFHMVERMNRQVTAIATYELEMARMEANPTTAEKAMSAEQKRTKAADLAVYEAQRLNGSASMSTAPRLTQRSLGRVMFMYKNYGITVSTVLYQTAKQIAVNMSNGDPKLRNQAMRQLTGHIGATFLMAGVKGLPLFGVYAAVANALRDDDEISAEEAARLWLGEMAYKGVINHVTGFEVSDRVGLSGLLYRSNRYNQDASAEETLVQAIGGAPWAVATRLGRGISDIASGEYQRGLESLMPIAISNVMQAARFASEGGVRTRQNNFMYEDPSAGELFGKLLGFNMAELTRRQDRASEMSRIGKAVQDRKTQLLTRLFVAYRSGDTAEVNRAREAIVEFNNTVGRRYPSAAISGETVESSFKRRADSVAEMVNGVSVNPQVRPILLEQYGAMIDGITRN